MSRIVHTIAPLLYIVCFTLIFQSFLTVSAQSTDVTSPDIVLNANVTVPLIQLLVQNLSAHVAVDAQVASLVHLSVGVDVSISQVNLTIEGTHAEVHFAARLTEVTKIVQAVMNSLNLNPILYALSQGLVADVGALTGVQPGTNTSATAGTLSTAATTPYGRVTAASPGGR